MKTEDSVTVLGTRFVAVPERGADTVRCTTCGALVDVGGELRWHAEEHAPDFSGDNEW